MGPADPDDQIVHSAREGGSDDELAAQLHEMRDELTRPGSASAREQTLAAMHGAAADPTLEEPLDATAEATVLAMTPRRPHRAVVLVAAATVGVLALTGGLAAAGRLPRGAQNRVADVAAIVGVDIPKHQDSSSSPGNGTDRPSPSSSAPRATGSAPAVGPKGPGATGTLPGSSGSAPGHSPTGPGSSEHAPGHTKDGGGSAPGPVTAPTTPTTAPGNSGSAPGHDKGTTGTTAPGSSGSAPGHNKDADSDGPGKSNLAPGQEKKTTSDSKGAQGGSSDAPGHNRDTTVSSSVQGTDQ